MSTYRKAYVQRNPPATKASGTPKQTPTAPRKSATPRTLTPPNTTNSTATGTLPPGYQRPKSALRTPHNQ
jgi:hypothetical protein